MIGALIDLIVDILPETKVGRIILAGLIFLAVAAFIYFFFINN